MPAIPGLTSVASWRETLFKLLPDCKRSSGRRCGVRARYAGAKSPAKVPSGTAITTSCQRITCPPRASSAKSPTSTARRNIGDYHHAPWLEAISKPATQEDGGNARQAIGAQDNAKLLRRPAVTEDKPRQGNLIEDVAYAGDELPDKEEAKRGHAQRRQDAARSLAMTLWLGHRGDRGSSDGEGHLASGGGKGSGRSDGRIVCAP